MEQSSFLDEDEPVTSVTKKATSKISINRKNTNEGEWGFAKLDNKSTIDENVKEMLDEDMDSDEREWEASQMAKVLSPVSASSLHKPTVTDSKVEVEEEDINLDMLEAEYEKDLRHLEDSKRNTLILVQDLEAKLYRLSSETTEPLSAVDSERTTFYTQFLQAINDAVNTQQHEGIINLEQVYAFVERWHSEYPEDFDRRLAQLD